jgi:hypothetical protein
MFKSSAFPTRRAYLNEQALAPQDVQIVEQATGIPVSGYTVSTNNNALRLETPYSQFTGFNDGATGTLYDVQLKSTLQTSMGTAIGPMTLTFKTRPIGGNVRPRMQAGGDTKYATDPSGVTVDIRVNTYDFDSTLSVTAQDSPNTLFNPTLTSSGGDYGYQSGGPEGNLTTPGDHVVTYTATDTPGSHTVTIADKAFIFNTASFPTLSVTGGTTSRPTYHWTAIPGGLGADGVALVVMKQNGPNFNPVYLSIVDPAALQFQQPADFPLTTGTYVFGLHFFHATDGSFKSGSSEGQTNNSATFNPPVMEKMKKHGLPVTTGLLVLLAVGGAALMKGGRPNAAVPHPRTVETASATDAPSAPPSASAAGNLADRLCLLTGKLEAARVHDDSWRVSEGDAVRVREELNAALRRDGTAWADVIAILVGQEDGRNARRVAASLSGGGRRCGGSPRDRPAAERVPDGCPAYRRSPSWLVPLGPEPASPRLVCRTGRGDLRPL